MNLRTLICSSILVLGLGAFASAQTTTALPDSASTQSDQGAKSDIKDAGHDTARATKKTGRKVKRGTKKATHKAAQKTRQGSEKVENKTTTPPQR